MGMTNEEREKHIRIANMLIGAINDLIRPMLMYQIEKDVAKEALENYIKMLESQSCEDCISREDAMNLFLDGTEGYDCRGFTRMEIGEMLDDLPSVTPKPRWIPVSERLPKSDEEYHTFLVTDSKGNVTLSEFYLSISDRKPYWSGMIDVIAWMPRPEPYKPESEDKE